MMPSKKLTQEDVEMMFELYHVHGVSRAEIARKFEIGWHYCHRILQGVNLRYWSEALLKKHS